MGLLKQIAWLPIEIPYRQFFLSKHSSKRQTHREVRAQSQESVSDSLAAENI